MRVVLYSTPQHLRRTRANTEEGPETEGRRTIPTETLMVLPVQIGPHRSSVIADSPRIAKQTCDISDQRTVGKPLSRRQDSHLSMAVVRAADETNALSDDIEGHVLSVGSNGGQFAGIRHGLWPGVAKAGGGCGSVGCTAFDSRGARPERTRT